MATYLFSTDNSLETYFLIIIIADEKTSLSLFPLVLVPEGLRFYILA